MRQITFFGKTLPECSDDELREAVAHQARQDRPFDLTDDVEIARALRVECGKRGIPYDQAYYAATHRDEISALEAELEALPCPSPTA